MKGIYINEKDFRTFDQLSLQKEIATRAVVSGAFSSWFGILPDPDPVLRKMNKDQTVYKDLLVDDEVGSKIERRKMNVKKLDWQITKGDDATDKEVQLCELVFKNLQRNKCKVKDIISQALNPVFWGYNVFEITWEEVDGYWLPKRVQEKPREWFYFDDDNNLVFKPSFGENIKLTGPEADPVMKHRFTLLQNDPTYENPYGNKALSKCFWPVTFKRGGMKFLAVFVEKYGMPHVIGKQPRGQGVLEANELLSKLESMVQDAITVIPDDSSVEIKTEHVAKGSVDIFEKFIDINNDAIAKAILTNALSTEVKEVGARASSQTGLEIERDIADMDKDFVIELFNEVFQSTIDLNIGNGKYPVMDVYEEEDVNKELAERDEKLKNQGVKFTKKYYMNKYNFDEDDIELTETIPQNKPAEFSSPAKLDIKSLLTADKLPVKLLQFQAERLLQPLIELAKKSDDYIEFNKSLSALYPQMDESEIQQLAQKIIFISETAGRFDAEIENG